MQKTAQIPQQNPYLVRRVSIIDSVKSIPAGVTATFDCREAGGLSSAKSCVCRLNQAVGWEQYKVVTTDNGATYSITHNTH
jgi:hypothetical protein